MQSQNKTENWIKQKGMQRTHKITIIPNSKKKTIDTRLEWCNALSLSLYNVV